MTGYIHSLQSLGTVDGPGVRAVVFASGCPLRCVFCHNPDTWHMAEGFVTEHTELLSQIKRLYPYIKDGGVTFSGGEPCLQPKFFTALAGELKGMGLHIALDTSGAILNGEVLELLEVSDLILLDIKYTDEENYKLNTGGTLGATLDFLDTCDKMGKEVWIRHVVIPGSNDTEDDVLRLANLVRDFGCVSRIELLPFRKLCLEKYKNLGIPFPLENTDELGEERREKLQRIADAELAKFKNH